MNNNINMTSASLICAVTVYVMVESENDTIRNHPKRINRDVIRSSEEGFRICLCPKDSGILILTRFPLGRLV